MKPKAKVELWPAHGWTCDECGRDNFCRGVTMEISEEDRVMFLAEFGDDTPDGQWMLAPEHVECVHCGAAFDTESQDD